MKIDPNRIEVVDDKVAEILRKKTYAERLAMMFDLDRFARRVMSAWIKSQQPEWTSEEIEREVARRWQYDESR